MKFIANYCIFIISYFTLCLLIMKLFILFLFIIVSLKLNAQPPCSSDNTLNDGFWNNDFIWNNNCAPNCDLSGPLDIKINHYITSTCNMSFNNRSIIVNSGGTLYIQGDLIISGGTDFIIKGGGELIIDSNSTLIGNGDITVDSGATVTVNGNMNLTGNGDYEINGELYVNKNLTTSGSGYWFGTGCNYIGINSCDNWSGPGCCKEFTLLKLDSIVKQPLLKKESKHQIYPNPATSIVHITNGYDIYKIKIINTQGIEYNVIGNYSKKECIIHLDNLEKGIYFVWILNYTGKNTTEKIKLN